MKQSHSQKTFIKTSGVIFFVVSIFHLWIAATDTVLFINSSPIASSLHWLAFIVIGYMAIVAFRVRG